MKITVLYQFFQSDDEPGHTLIRSLAQHLRAHGEQVSVVSSEYGYMHPRPIKIPFRRRLLRSETIDGVPVTRTFSYAYGHGGFGRRALSIASFSVSCLFGLFRGPRPDVIYASSPPLLPMFSAWLVSRIRGAPLVLEVRDLWPASLVELAALSGRPAISVMSWLERFLYDRSTMIIALTEGIRGNIIARGWPPEKVHTIRYGVSAQRFSPDQDAGKRVRAEEGWEKCKIVLYLGAHGLANNLDVVLRAADRLRGRPDIRFVLIGDGIDKQRLVAAAKGLGLSNVTFRAPISARDAAAYINAADLCVATLRDTPLFRGAVPSKLIEYMACGKAVVVGVRGEAEAIVERAGAGLVFDPDDDARLAVCVEALLDDPERRAVMGRGGCRDVREHFSLERSQSALHGLLAEVLQRQNG